MLHPMLNEPGRAQSAPRRWLSLSAFFVHCLAVLGFSLAAGCAGLPGGSPHHVGSDDQVVVLNAKERVLHRSAARELVKTQEKSDGTSKETVVTRERLRRVCAEPSPDVFAVAAMSLGLEGEVAKKGSADFSLGLKYASSLSEQAAGIARSQTMNVLREVMYRTCERYLSGALEDEEFIIQAHRDQQLIVQVLAIEQLTQAYQAQAIALQTSAAASSTGVTELSIKTLASAREDVSAATSGAKKASEDAGKQKPGGACSAKPLDPAKPPEGASADEVKKKNELCDKAKDASMKQAAAEAYYESVRAATEKLGASSAQARGEAQRLGDPTEKAAAATQTVADAVLKIVNRTPALTEFELSCVVYYRKLLSEATKGNNNQEKSDLAAACRNLIQSRWNLQTQINNREAEEVQKILNSVRLEAEQIFKALSKADAAPRVQALSTGEYRTTFSKLQLWLLSLESFQRYYGGLLRKYQIILQKAAEPSQ